MKDAVGTGYLLNRAELAVRSCVETMLQPHGVTPMQFLVLYSLRMLPGQSSAELARQVGVRPQSMAEIIRPLERARLIVRRATPGQGRVLRINVTMQGEGLLSRCVPLAMQLERELLSSFKPALLTALREGLETLRRNAEARTRSPGRRRQVPRNLDA